jgi:pantoate--beta-alanine ligase
MRIVSSVRQMQAVSLRFRREGRRIGFVPTMGFLHEGHLSLMKRATQASDRLVVSIFVNPIQFGPGEDLAAYPRDPKRDRRLCRKAGVDVLFCPSRRDMYASDHTVYVEETRLSAGLCGASRPGHFRGVATVVAKLFNAVLPDAAVFGQKDAQQAAVIERMTRDLNFPVRIIVAPTVREPDGLAMSSRNAYLSKEERGRAACLCRALRLAERLHKGGERDAGRLVRAAREVLRSAGPVRIEYIEAVDRRTLEPVSRIRGDVLLALAVRIGRTRLIDNTVLKADG